MSKWNECFEQRYLSCPVYSHCSPWTHTFFCSHPSLHAVFWTLCLWTAAFSRVRCPLMEQGMFLGTSMQLAHLASLLEFDNHCWGRLDNILYFHFYTKWQSSNACHLHLHFPIFINVQQSPPSRYRYCAVLQSSWFGKTGTETERVCEDKSMRGIISIKV